MNTNVRVSMNRINETLASTSMQKDLSKIKSEVGVLTTSLKKISETLVQDNSNNNNNNNNNNSHKDMDDLERLDIVRKNMLRCKTRLEGAAKWSRQVRHVQQVLDTSNSSRKPDLDTVTEDFRSLQELEFLLKEMPAAKERSITKQKLIHRLKDEILLPSLQSRVDDNSSTSNAGNIKSLIRAFHEMGLSHMARDCYVEKRSEIFAQIWENAQRDDQDIAMWLPETYDRVSRLLTEESRRISDLFVASEDENIDEDLQTYRSLCVCVDFSHDMIALYYTHTHTHIQVRFFQKISKSFQARLGKVLKKHPKTSVVVLTRLFCLTKEFATSRFGNDDDEKGEIINSILNPYKHFQKRYGELETDHLTSCLEDLNLDRRMMMNTIDHADAVMIASEALSSLFLRLESAIERCVRICVFMYLFHHSATLTHTQVQFTNGIETSSLFNAIEMTLTEFVSTLKRFVEKIRKNAETTNDVKKKHEEKAQDIDDLFDVGEGDGSTEHGVKTTTTTTFFSGAVQLVRVSFRLYVRLDSVEDILRERLTKVFDDDGKSQDVISSLEKQRQRDVMEIRKRLKDVMTPLLSNAQNLVSKFASICEELLFQLLLRPITQDLNGVESLTVWNAKSSYSKEDDLDALPEYVHAST